MNIFKGARRLALVIGVAGAGYAADLAWSHSPYLQLGYIVTDTGKELVRSLDCPSLNDGVYRQFYHTMEHNEFQARICFPGTRTVTGTFQIHIQQADGKRGAYLVGMPEAEEAMRIYVADHFRLTPADLAYAEQAYHVQQNAERRDKLLDIAVLLAAYFACVTAVGWVARGFLDIPYGADRRPYQAKDNDS